MSTSLSRRGFLASAGAFVVAISLPVRAAAEGAAEAAELNAFVVIETDGTTLLQIPSCEMGQGITTALPQIVMDELDADFDKLRVVTVAGDDYRIALPMGIKQQFTGGSLTVQYWAESFQEAGAVARAQLIAAAAAQWGVSPDRCTTDTGVVKGPDGQEAGYGELAPAAAKMKVGKVENRNTGRYVGRSIPRTDLYDKVIGKAEFGIDIRREGMMRAALAQAPVFGAKVASVDDAAARAVPGVTDVMVFDTWVAVIAKTWWPANKAVKLLDITWDTDTKEAMPDLDDAGVSAALLSALDDTNKKVHKHGNTKKALKDAEVFERTYETPFLEHAPIEPMNATVLVTDDRCDVWSGMQAQTLSMRGAKRITGLKKSQIHLHTTLLGGGFGRRGNTDFVEQAVAIGNRMRGTPVQLIWSREECMQHGWYRPAAAGRVRARLTDGSPDALEITVSRDNVVHRYIPGILHGLKPVMEAPLEGLIHEMPYGFEHYRVEYALCDLPVPVGFWRAVGHGHNAFFMESFLDELAHEAGKDPVELRRGLLDAHPRWRTVLDTAVEKGNWGKPEAGHTQGVALHASFGSIVGMVAEVAIDGAGKLTVRKLTASVDCGRAINPDIVEAQIMGGALFALSELKYGGLKLEGGRVTQSNYHDYALLRMHESTDVEVHIIDSGAELGGIGEVGVPPVAPAICNAIFAATGQRIRKLPLPPTLEVPS